MQASAQAPAGGVGRLLALLSRGMDYLQPLFALATRLYVSEQFRVSGWGKLTRWDNTLALFQDEYHVPLLPPTLAAVVGTFGELFFPLLVVLGLGGRIGPLGLFAVNAMAVISYTDVLLAEGAEAALGQHILWGFMLAMLSIYGTGALSVDKLIARRFGWARGW